MRGNHGSAPRWVGWLAPSLLGVLLLACIVPATVPGIGPRPAPSLTPRPSDTPLPTPTATRQAPSATVARITEQQMNEWLGGFQTHLGEGVNCKDLHITIRTSGILISGSVQVAQLQNAEIPMEIEMRPLVDGQRVNFEVIDVRLGGPYGTLSSLVKPLVTSGIAHTFDANRFLAEQGVRVTQVELQDGYVIVTTEPVGR